MPNRLIPRRWLIRGGVAVVLLAGLWFFAARWCALLVDQFYRRAWRAGARRPDRLGHGSSS